MNVGVNNCNIEKEYYLAALIDREFGRITLMASSEGGMDIEEVAESTPEKILTVGDAIKFIESKATN
mgnify:CR=1 FL=1